MKYISFMLIFSLVFAACDCWTVAEGIVVDEQTHATLDSVVVRSYINKIEAKHFEMEILTDSTGLYYGSTGNTGGCQDLVLQLIKNGYDTLIVENPEIGDTLYMQR